MSRTIEASRLATRNRFIIRGHLCLDQGRDSDNVAQKVVNLRAARVAFMTALTDPNVSLPDLQLAAAGQARACGELASIYASNPETAVDASVEVLDAASAAAVQLTNAAAIKDFAGTRREDLLLEAAALEQLQRAVQNVTRQTGNFAELLNTVQSAPVADRPLTPTTDFGGALGSVES